MKDNDLKKIIEAAHRVKLSEEEKSGIKRSVLNFISNNPIKPGIEPRLAYGSSNSFWPAIFLTRLSFVPSMALLLLILISLGGGVMAGAQKSLPGDTLYSVKVNFNEEVKALAMVSEESKADWEIERANLRLQEAEQLEAKGGLNAETRQKIEANFEIQAEKVKDRVKKMEDKENFNSAVTVSSNFETSLNAHTKILSKLADAGAEAQGRVGSIEGRVRTKVTETKKNREKNESKVSARVQIEAKNSADKKRKEAENKLEEVRRFIKRFVAESEIKNQAEAKLLLAGNNIAEGKIKLEAKAYGDAFVLFQKSISIAQEAKLILQAGKRLNIEVRISDKKESASFNAEFED